MSNEIFTKKYRPNYLKDFNIKDLYDSLITFIKTDNINILLNGSIGTGKTSLLNAIVREYYKNTDILSNDNILSISTLKEQGISYYRNEVKVFCQSSSSISGKKKVILLDDFDCVNEQGQQVFTNYIDKYSHNVCFIVSCTNIQKIIGCIQSRLDIVKIRPHSLDDLTKIASGIIHSENISLDDDVVSFISNVCNGSVRVLINYLEKFKLINKHIDKELASQLCTNISFKELDSYTEYCISKNHKKAMEVLNLFVDKGYSVTDILDSYFTYIKQTKLINEDIKYKIIPIICKYVAIFHNVHEDEIELYFFTNNIILIFSNSKL
jgi:DNA polymerase III delta prime subunit